MNKQMKNDAEGTLEMGVDVSWSGPWEKQHCVDKNISVLTNMIGEIPVWTAESDVSTPPRVENIMRSEFSGQKGEEVCDMVVQVEVPRLEMINNKYVMGHEMKKSVDEARPSFLRLTKLENQENQKLKLSRMAKLILILEHTLHQSQLRNVKYAKINMDSILIHSVMN
jgi:hypothetical protein